MAPFDCSTKAPLLFEIEIVEKVIPAVTKYIARSGKTPETNVFSLFRIIHLTFGRKSESEGIKIFNQVLTSSDLI